mgnify:CR=1 FL=1
MLPENPFSFFVIAVVDYSCAVSAFLEDAYFPAYWAYNLHDLRVAGMDGENSFDYAGMLQHDI